MRKSLTFVDMESNVCVFIIFVRFLCIHDNSNIDNGHKIILIFLYVPNDHDHISITPSNYNFGVTTH